MRFAEWRRWSFFQWKIIRAWPWYSLSCIIKSLRFRCWISNCWICFIIWTQAKISLITFCFFKSLLFRYRVTLITLLYTRIVLSWSYFLLFSLARPLSFWKCKWLSFLRLLRAILIRSRISHSFFFFNRNISFRGIEFCASRWTQIYWIICTSSRSNTPLLFKSLRLT